MESKKVIEVNNGRKLELEFHKNYGLCITTIDSNGEIERVDRVDDGEIVMLLNLYQALRQNDEKSAYVLTDFSRKILEQTGAADFAEEYQIIN